MEKIITAIDKWCDDNSDLFERYHPSSPVHSISVQNDLIEKPSNITLPSAEYRHPGLDFYSHPAVVLTRDYSYDPPNSEEFSKVDRSLFTFNKEEVTNEQREMRLKALCHRSPPLLSIFSDDTNCALIKDPRQEISPYENRENVGCFTLKFNKFTSTAEIIEPIFVNVFLWDNDRKTKITETWRFFVDYPKMNDGLKSLFNDVYKKSILEISMPEPINQTQTYVIIYLDRLLYKGAGSNLAKYYEKPNKSTTAAALNDVDQCNQKHTTTTFAWSAKSFEDFISGENEQSLFENFQYAQTVNDSFLTKEIDNYNKKGDKGLKFKVLFDILEPKSNIPQILHYFDLRPLPFIKFVNRLIIQPIHARFKFPRGHQHGRNIFAEFRIVVNDKPLPLFNNGNSDVYVSRCQYHVDSPYFNEDIVVSLPIDLPTNVSLKIDFIHAALKAKAKSIREHCGTSVFQLFQSIKKEKSAFAKNGVHKVGISYTENYEHTIATEQNYFAFSLLLQSSIYSSDKNIVKIFNGNFEKIGQFDIDQLIPHLYSVLDSLITGILKGDKKAFLVLIQIMSVYQNDTVFQEVHVMSYYLRCFALRRENEANFHKSLLKIFDEYLTENKFTKKRADLVAIRYLLELIVKSAVINKTIDFPIIMKIISTLSSYIKSFRDSGQSIGNRLNKSLCLFYKDLFEIFPKDRLNVIEMVKVHLKNINYEKEESNAFDRECFIDFFQDFITPKIFLYLIAPYDDNNNCLFNDLFLSHFEATMNIDYHTNLLFKILFNILSQYEPNEYEYIVDQLIPLLYLIGKKGDNISQYSSKSFQVFPLSVGHFILHSTDFIEFTDELATVCVLFIKEASHLSQKQIEDIEEKGKNTGFSDSITKEMMANLTARMSTGNANLSQSPTSSPESQSRRRFASLRKNPLLASDSNKNDEFIEIFNALAFCVQVVMIKLGISFPSVKALNSITAKLLDVEIAPALSRSFNDFLKSIVDDYETFFLDNRSDMKHIFKRLFESIDEEKLKLIEKCIELDKKKRGNTVLTDALVHRSLFKVGVSDSSLEIYKKSAVFKDIATNLHEINKMLADQELRKNNYDVYSDLLFRKANLLSGSPDARVNIILELTVYHDEMGYQSEAVISRITAAALVAEYLLHLSRIPPYFNCKNPALAFSNVAPSAVTEVCPLEKVKFLPNTLGFCTSKYFSEYGLIYLITTAMNTCKRAGLYEIFIKIQSIFAPIAVTRGLWYNLMNSYNNGAHAWVVVDQNQTSSDRSLGNYYRVQFQNKKVYIYRETKLANLWQVCERLKSSTSVISGGKEVVVINEGEELKPEVYENTEKYHIHVKSVQQYFTSDERKKRVTVFEQNHNIAQFYFDIPISKTAQSSIEHCSLKRTIFTIPHPLPYLVKRVEVPKENIKTVIFSPIEFSCQNLQRQIDLIDEACMRKDFTALQPLIQGSLLVQVNEGPKKIAEVFLGNGIGNEQSASLRNIFRKFLVANTKAVLLHATYAKQNPVFRVLQDELESGLNQLTSSLQPYLK